LDWLNKYAFPTEQRSCRQVPSLPTARAAYRESTGPALGAVRDRAARVPAPGKLGGNDTRPDSKISYNRGMNENLSRELLAWLTQAGLAGTPESDIFSVFCDRCVAAGIPLGRAHVAIDTLHPVHEGSLFRWGYPNEPPVYEYGRTSLEGLDASGAVSLDAQLARRCYAAV